MLMLYQVLQSQAGHGTPTQTTTAPTTTGTENATNGNTLNKWYPIAKTTTETTVEGDSYTATAQGFGGEVSVTVVLNGSDIVDVKVVGDNETPGIGTNAIDQLPAAIVAADSADVDVVSGASITSGAILDAVKDILAQAQ